MAKIASRADSLLRLTLLTFSLLGTFTLLFEQYKPYEATKQDENGPNFDYSKVSTPKRARWLTFGPWSAIRGHSNWVVHANTYSAYSSDGI